MTMIFNRLKMKLHFILLSHKDDEKQTNKLTAEVNLCSKYLTNTYRLK